MESIPQEQVLKHIRAENPWWSPPHQITEQYRTYTRRAYFEPFYPLVPSLAVRRAVVLMGPRRVGKTVLLLQAVDQLLRDGVPPRNICYFSVDHPIYNGLRLDQLVEHFSQAAAVDLRAGPFYMLFDEIQYLRNWELHLKGLVDQHAGIKFIATGSSAAALRLKSTESGAGRFTDFLLPPLTFHEYLVLLGKTALVTPEPRAGFFRSPDIDGLNETFLHYLNFGGYPEVIFSPVIQSNPQRYIKNDIVDKVLLRDLPGLYGISDIQELNHLFTTLAYNTAQEVSLEELSQNSGVAKNTLKRYIEYLEAAFLLRVVHRIDRTSRRFRRANFFKVYLTNPSMRSALFSPVSIDDQAVGPLTETAIFSQWFHADRELFYARWSHGEVDLVNLDGQKPAWVVEVKWSDNYVEHPERLGSLLDYCRVNPITSVLVTTRTRFGAKTSGQTRIEFVPASLYCYTVGYNVVKERRRLRRGASA
ncbi:MAG: ATP-binding protein [Planctomycetota bacterium]